MHIFKYLTIVLLLLAQFSFANEELSSKKSIISKITFVDDLGKSLTDENLRNLLTLEIEKELDVKKLMDDLEKLSSELKDRYPNIELEILPLKNDKVEIKFALQRNRTINNIVIRAKGENPKDLRKKLSSIKGESLRSSKVKQDNETIKKYFKDRGYPFSEVSHEIKLKNDEAIIIFNADLNSKELKVKEVKISGNKSFNKKDLLHIMKVKPVSLFTSDKPLSVSKLEEDIKNLKEHYIQHGFLQAKVEYSIKAYKKKKAKITIKVIEGPRLKLESITISGNEAISKEEIEKAINLKTPRYFSVNEQKKALQSVRDLYGSKGYALSQVQMSYDDKTGVSGISIIEGKVQRILLVEIIGNSKTNRSTIEEKLTFNRGERVNSIEIKNSIKALFMTGFFKDVKIDYIPLTETEGKIVIQVVENATRVIQFSLGSVYGSAGIGAGLNENNLFGTGSSISFNALLSKELSRLNLIYQDPHLFGSDISMTASLSHDIENSYHYNKKKTAIRLMMEKRINENISLGLGTRLEYVTPENISALYQDTITDLSENTYVSGLISTFAYTKENTDLDGRIKSGSKISMVMMPSYADQKLFFKTVSSISGFKNFGFNRDGNSHQISGRITLGYASESSPFFEKFQGGGHGTIRGFEYGSINNQGTLGGNTSISANVTYSFPIFKDAVNGVVFMDAFSLGDANFNMGDMRLVGGLGMKAKLQTGLINESMEAGFTIPLIKKDGDITKPFYFIFGDYDPAYNL